MRQNSKKQTGNALFLPPYARGASFSGHFLEKVQSRDSFSESRSYRGLIYERNRKSQAKKEQESELEDSAELRENYDELNDQVLRDSPPLRMNRAKTQMHPSKNELQ